MAEPASEQDRAAVTIAAFAGLRRGEILALRWKNVDFTARKLRVRKTYVMGEEASPKGRRVRAVDMADQVASVLARLGQRDHHVVPDDLVLVNAKVAKNVSTER